MFSCRILRCLTFTLTFLVRISCRLRCQIFMKMTTISSVITTIALLVTMAMGCRTHVDGDHNVQWLPIEKRGDLLMMSCTVDEAPSNITRCLHWLVPQFYDIVPCHFNSTSLYTTDNGLSLIIEDASEKDAGEYICASMEGNVVQYSRTTVYYSPPTTWQQYQSQFLAAIISALVALAILVLFCLLIHFCCSGPHKKDSIDITMETMEHRYYGSDLYRKRQSTS